MPNEPTRQQFLGRFRRNGATMVSLVAGLAGLAALIVGAGFAGISKDGSATPFETLVVRWCVLLCLAVGIASYVIGQRMPRNDRG